MDNNSMSTGVNFHVERTEFSDIALSVLDVICDISRISKDLTFKHSNLLDIINHFVNFYYVNFPDTMTLDYVDNNTDVPTEGIKSFLDDRTLIYSDNKGYKQFRHIYSLAVISEFIASDVILFSTDVNEDSTNVTTYYRIKESLVNKKRLQFNVARESYELPVFGLNLISERDYLNSQVQITNIKNDSFDMTYGNLAVNLNIGILIYIAIGERYAKNKESVISALLTFVDGSLPT